MKSNSQTDIIRTGERQVLLNWVEGGQCGPRAEQLLVQGLGGGLCDPLAEQLEVAMLQFPMGGIKELLVAGRQCVNPCEKESFVGRSLCGCTKRLKSIQHLEICKTVFVTLYLFGFELSEKLVIQRCQVFVNKEIITCLVITEPQLFLARKKEILNL